MLWIIQFVCLGPILYANVHIFWLLSSSFFIYVFAVLTCVVQRRLLGTQSEVSCQTMLRRGCEYPMPLLVNKLEDKLHVILPRPRKLPRFACSWLSFFAMFIMVRFLRSTTRFCCRVHGAVSWRLISFSLQNLGKFWDKNSLPQSVLKVFSLWSYSFSMSLLNFFNARPTLGMLMTWCYQKKGSQFWDCILPSLPFLWAWTPTSNNYNRQQVRDNTCYQLSMMEWSSHTNLHEPVVMVAQHRNWFEPEMTVLLVWRLDNFQIACLGLWFWVAS